MTQTVITNSFKETQNLGANFAKQLNGINVLALYGDLGSGKTTFIQGLARGLNINNKIISPTFIIMREYELTKHLEGGKTSTVSSVEPLQKSVAMPVRLWRNSFQVGELVKIFYHVDLYRIKNDPEIQELGILDLMKDSENLFAIEWPEKIEKFLPKKRINLYFEYVDEDKRRIIIDCNVPSPFRRRLG